jgi:uncharacterized membrane protein YeaQ/YmgE (transglycosylase-associated protein family)
MSATVTGLGLSNVIGLPNLTATMDLGAFSTRGAEYLSTRQEENLMSFVIWIVLGLAAGFIGGRLGKRKGEGILPDIVLGVVGAVAGGWLCYTFGPAAVNGLHLFSLYAAVIGSLVFLLAYYAYRRY